jgi:hypothetical protein
MPTSRSRGLPEPDVDSLARPRVRGGIPIPDSSNPTAATAGLHPLMTWACGFCAQSPRDDGVSARCECVRPVKVQRQALGGGSKLKDKN